MNEVTKIRQFKIIEIFVFSTDENASPQANAGGDKTLIEPVNALILNGSQSSDDLRIKQWLWTRDSESLAIGNIVNGTDKSPILMVIVSSNYFLKIIIQ